MLTKEILAKDLDFIFSDFPQEIEFNGKTYRTAANDLSQDSDYEIAGLKENPKIEFVVKLADFTKSPVIGDTIKYENKDFDIVQTSDSACGISRTLICEGAR